MVVHEMTVEIESIIMLVKQLVEYKEIVIVDQYLTKIKNQILYHAYTIKYVTIKYVIIKYAIKSRQHFSLIVCISSLYGA